MPEGVFETVVGGGAVGAALVDEQVGRRLLHGQLRHRPAHRRARRAAHDPPAARARRQGSHVRDRRCRRARRGGEPRGRGDVQRRTVLLLGRAHLRSRTGRIRVRGGVHRVRARAFASASRRIRRRTSAPWRGPLSSTCSTAQVADAVAHGASVLVGGKRAARPGAYYEADGRVWREKQHENHARGELRAHHRHRRASRATTRPSCS